MRPSVGSVKARELVPTLPNGSTIHVDIVGGGCQRRTLDFDERTFFSRLWARTRRRDCHIHQVGASVNVFVGLLGDIHGVARELPMDTR